MSLFELFVLRVIDLDELFLKLCEANGKEFLTLTLFDMFMSFLIKLISD